MDEGHKLTDKILANLEKGLLESYKESYKTIKPLLEDVRDTIEALGEEVDPVKRLVLMRREERLSTLLNDISRDIRTANVTATKMINNEMLNVYEENINFAHYFMEQEGGYLLNYDLYNKEIIKKLYADNENPFTKIALNHIKDKSRVYRDLRTHFTSAIRNGETIDEIAKRVQGVVLKNYNSSVRIARTETTRLESMGRQESFKKGQELGLKMKKVWISTHDKRTRESHLLLNGKAIDMDKKFSNGLLYPADYGGKAHEVINCRCTHIVELQGIEKSAELQKLDDNLREESYSEWKRRKGEEAKNPFIKEVKKVNINNAETIEQVNSILLNELKDRGLLNVDLTGANLEKAKEVGGQFLKLMNEYNTEPILEFKIDDVFKNKTTQAMVSRIGDGKESILFLRKGYMQKYTPADKYKEIKTNLMNFNSVVNKENANINIITHEFAHTFGVSNQNNNKGFWKEIKAIRTKYNKEFKQIDKDNIVNKTITTEEAKKLKSKIFISDYANENVDEFLAEAFTEAKLSSNPSRYSIEVLKIVDKYFKKR